jgi:hypothetical protein
VAWKSKSLVSSCTAKSTNYYNKLINWYKNMHITYDYLELLAYGMTKKIVCSNTT